MIIGLDKVDYKTRIVLRRDIHADPCVVSWYIAKFLGLCSVSASGTCLWSECELHPSLDPHPPSKIVY